MRTFVLYSLLIFTSLASKTSLDRLQSASVSILKTSKHNPPGKTKLPREIWWNATHPTSSDNDRRRKPSLEAEFLAGLKNIAVCGGSMVAGAFIEDLKDAMKPETPHFNGDHSKLKNCQFLKDRFLKYIQNCHLTGSPKTVYAGWTTDTAALIGMSEAHGAYLSSTGQFGCFHEYCGSVGLQVAISGAFTVGVVFGDQNELAGLSGGVEGGPSVGAAGVPIGAGLTANGVPWIESGFSAGISEGNSGFICNTTIGQDPLNAEKMSLLEHWAQVNRQTGDTWRMGFCDGKNGQRVSLSKGGGELHKMSQCLTKCRGISAAKACEYVTKSSTTRDPGCYYYTTNVEQTDNQPAGMCYYNLNPSPCFSDENWLDSYGDSCAVYERENWCRDGRRSSGWEPQWGPISKYADHNGVSAYQACCACGKPAEKSLGGCTDYDGWVDYSSDTCEDYRSSRWCENGRKGAGWNDQWGKIEHYKNCYGLFCAEEVHAMTACCICGGGNRD